MVSICKRRFFSVVILLAVLIATLIIPSNCFQWNHGIIFREKRKHAISSSLSSSSSSTTTTVERLLKEIQDSNEETNKNRDKIRTLMEKLPSPDDKDNENELDEEVDWKELIGYYNVSYTLFPQKNSKDNPVGGKWTRSQRLWKIRRTLQHVLPIDTSSTATTTSGIVAQAINVVRLDCFWGRLPVWIVLRGDAVPLSMDSASSSSSSSTSSSTTTTITTTQEATTKPKGLLPNLSARAVRVSFDPPRIALGSRKRSLVFSLGPTSSVVLDTPYVDDKIRIGVGGTSGTKFVFRRIQNPEEDMEATRDWKFVLSPTTATTKQYNNKGVITKRKAGIAFATIACLSGWVVKQLFSSPTSYSFSSTTSLLIWKVMASLSSVFSVLGFAWVLSSTGGIETRGNTYTPGK